MVGLRRGVFSKRMHFFYRLAGKRIEKEVESKEPDWAKLNMFQTDPDQEQKEDERNVRLIYLC